MKNKYDIFINNGLFNHSGIDFVVCYHRRNRAFTIRKLDSRIGVNLIVTPYVDVIQHTAMEKFWHMLDDEKRALAESYGEKRGFFQFLRESGLIAYYDLAYADAAEEIIALWEINNKLKINWECLKADWAIF